MSDSRVALPAPCVPATTSRARAGAVARQRLLGMWRIGVVGLLMAAVSTIAAPSAHALGTLGPAPRSCSEVDEETTPCLEQTYYGEITASRHVVNVGEEITFTEATRNNGTFGGWGYAEPVSFPGYVSGCTKSSTTCTFKIESGSLPPAKGEETHWQTYGAGFCGFFGCAGYYTYYYALAKGAISGFVREGSKPVEGATVTIAGPEGGSVQTDATGFYNAYVEQAGTYTVSVQGKTQAAVKECSGTTKGTSCEVEIGGAVDATASFAETSLIVNTTEDTPDTDPSTGCADSNGHCSLRGAIEAADAAGGSELIKFDIEGASGMPKITPTSKLPALTGEVAIDGASQPGTVAGQPGVQLDGSQSGNGPGLELDGAHASVSGMDITGYGTGDGVLLTGASDTLQESWVGVGPGGAGKYEVASNKIGVEVSGSGDTIGGTGSAGDVISGNGSVAGLEGAESSLSGAKPSTAEYVETLASYGAGILVQGAASNLSILGDWVGPTPAGEPIATAQGASLSSNAVGVVLAPSSGSLSGVQLGGAGGAGDVISENVIGVLASPARGGTLSGLQIDGDSFGPDPAGVGAVTAQQTAGLVAVGAIGGLQVGAAGQGDTFQDDVVGALLSGLSAPTIQGNTFGADEGYSASDHRTNLVGLALLESSGASIGGAGAAGNTIAGDTIGALVAGPKSKDDAITGNTVGRATDLGKTASTLAESEVGAVFGLLVAGGSETTVATNRIGEAQYGLGLFGTTASTVTGNTFFSDDVGAWDAGGVNDRIGEPGGGNTLVRNGVGLVALNANISSTETKDAGLGTDPLGQSEREAHLQAHADQDGLSLADAASSATVGPATVAASTATSTGLSVQGNTLGGEGNQGNDVGAILGEGLTGTLGGLGEGQSNTIGGGHEAGLWIVGSPGHEPAVAVLGNSIYDNYDASLPEDPVGLGIDLVGFDSKGGQEPGFGFGPNFPETGDPTQPDPNGPNGVQNYPVLSSAVSSGGNVKVTGTLTSAAGAPYIVQLYASEKCNTFGYGEGQHLIGTLTATTGASGSATFEQSAALPAGAQVVTATATSEASGAPLASSEFSKCLPVTSTPPPSESKEGSPSTGAPSSSEGSKVKSAAETKPPCPPGPFVGSCSLTTVPLSGPSNPVNAIVPQGTIEYEELLKLGVIPISGECDEACVITVEALIDQGKLKLGSASAAALRLSLIGRVQLRIAHGRLSVELHLSARGRRLLRRVHAKRFTITLRISARTPRGKRLGKPRAVVLTVVRGKQR